MKSRDVGNNSPLRILLDASFKGIKRLFVFAFDDTNNVINKVERNIHRKYFLPRVNVTNYNISISGWDFHDQPVGNQIKKYDEIRKLATGQEDDYTKDVC